MLILKLNLPTSSLTYNRVGMLISTPVPFAPERLKNTQMELTVQGYAAPDAFYAFSVESPDRAFTCQEQFNFLAMLGFKTVPINHYPDVAGTVDFLIKTKERYIQYQPIWWDMVKEEEYKLPALATINKVSWEIDDNRRLTMKLDTTRGTYYVIDMRAPEYFQVGLQIKVSGDQVAPYMSGPVQTSIPKYCPRCNNPLKKYQFSNDLPLIFKCVNPVCKLLKTTEESLDADMPDVEVIQRSVQVAEVTEPDTVTDTASADETVEVENNGPAELTDSVDAATSNNTLYESNDAATVHSVINNDRISLPADLAARLNEIQATAEDKEYIERMQPVCVLTKSKRSVTRIARQLSEQYNLPLVPADELADFLAKL